MLRKDGYYNKQFTQFWLERVDHVESAPLIIAGLGFDPRSMLSAKMISVPEPSDAFCMDSAIFFEVLPIRTAALTSFAISWPSSSNGRFLSYPPAIIILG